MSKQAVLEQVNSLGLLAVLRGPSPELTVKMVEALVAGGVKGIEITYSTPNAEEVVATLARRFGGEILLGMGTLTRPEQAEAAQAAGASFLVSPVCEPDLVRAMVATGLAVMAGALTPTEVLRAYQLGSDVVKVFPGSLTGPSYIKALKGPFPYIPMMPTGGVSATNVKDWFAAGVVAVGAGSELCPPQLAREGRFDEISSVAANFVRVVNESRPQQK
ncbi:MAG: bifunctional 4-hydroxy-2-oxoglutarate aldolase/2-dehydro-3-deoxy-phosphogluconate aldolase [Chloroflexi bacterium]|nr:bifunctional 4-hydroxy-2-oxoglutarate aldolase/2-dehydro-3-deoxy-phosphogluconate aldolase [Anaerolineaceae bacterium]NMB90766.1 bifunctional 4-hydroxy-2-oxoglutarate aldolase/2-dehydro-3-deoxy-phosphogluconate aldolase [Chloroflexota bacterium]